MSTDGFSYSNVGTNSSSLSMLFPQNSDFTLRLTVTCSTNEVKVAFLSVYNSDAQNCNPCAKTTPITQEELLANNILELQDKDLELIKIHPNPGIDKVRLDVLLSVQSRVEISLFDTYGKLVISQPSRILTKGTHTLVDDISNYPNGIYYYQILIGEQLASKKLIIQH